LAPSAAGPAQAMADGANEAVLVAAGLCLVGAAVALWARVAETRSGGKPVARSRPTVVA
jgi:hypothetical protein